MLKFICKRLLAIVPIIIIVTFLVFALLEIAPGDAADALAGENPRQELVDAIRSELRLDRPFFNRYVEWASHAVRGDLGHSYLTKQSVMKTVGERLPVTLSLGGIALGLTLVVGFVLGVAGAARPGKLLDRSVTVLCSAMLATPSFWLGLILVLFFSVRNPIFPTFGYAPMAEGMGEWLRHLVLPAIALSVNSIATLALQLKSALAEESGTDYILAARAKGLRRPSLLFKHSLKNAAVPVVTILGFRIAALISGAVIVETVFNLRGIGLLAQQSAQQQDVPVVIGIVTVSATFILILNVLVDVSYQYLNPKRRHA